MTSKDNVDIARIIKVLNKFDKAAKKFQQRLNKKVEKINANRNIQTK
jgi:hypothetical protein|tara:strand:- start:865 stop:1005 length:141 start_codon:yes stop_codon:yes gene_type:complete